MTLVSIPANPVPEDVVTGTAVGNHDRALQWLQLGISGSMAST
jgi:hypothetical protein